MYDVISFEKAFEIFTCGSLVSTYLTLGAYRIMASSPSRLILHGWRRYVSFYVAISIFAPFAFPFHDIPYIRGWFFFLLLSLPVLLSGTLGILKNETLVGVLVSCSLEIAFFPIWYSAVFKMLISVDLV